MIAIDNSPSRNIFLRRRSQGQDLPRIIHRGGSPENTGEAFETARRRGSLGVELDVQRTSDGILVVQHDNRVDRCTHGHGNIGDMTWAEVQKLEAGTNVGHGARIPTLASVLDWAREHGVQVDIELKDPSMYPHMDEEVVDMVRAKGLEHQVMVTSFDADVINALKRRHADLAMGLLIGDDSSQRGRLAAYAAVAPVGGGLLVAAAALMPVSRKASNRALQAGLATPCDVVLPSWTLVQRHFVNQVHAAGKTVVPWTSSPPPRSTPADSPRGQRRLAKAGIDAVITNVPGAPLQLAR